MFSWSYSRGRPTLRQLPASSRQSTISDLIPSLPRLSRVFDPIVAASSSAVVELSHAVGSFFLPAELLCRVSPVFMGWLSDSDGDDHVITVDGCTFSELQAFVALILAWPFYQGHTALRMAEAPYSLGELARGSHRSVNLVHKYDCRALMDLLRLALNARPSATGQTPAPLFPICGDPISPTCQKSSSFFEQDPQHPFSPYVVTPFSHMSEIKIVF